MHNTLTLNASGGLANRMRAILSAMALCERSGHKLEVVWQPLAELNAPFESLFKVESLPFKVLRTCGLGYYLKYCIPRKKNLYISKFWQSRNYDIVLDDRNLISEDTRNDLLNTIKESGNALVASGLPFYPFAESAFAEVFRPVEEIVKRVDTSLEPITGNLYGVHIRRTDNLQSIEHSPEGLFTDKIDEIIASDANASFYLASDDQDLKAKLKDKFGKRLIIRDIPLNRNSRAGIEEALVEMLILSRCREIFGSYYSSYSEVAAAMGNVPLTQLIKETSKEN